MVLRVELLDCNIDHEVMDHLATCIPAQVQLQVQQVQLPLHILYIPARVFKKPVTHSYPTVPGCCRQLYIRQHSPTPLPEW